MPFRMRAGATFASSFHVTNAAVMSIAPAIRPAHTIAFNALEDLLRSVVPVAGFVVIAGGHYPLFRASWATWFSAERGTAPVALTAALNYRESAAMGFLANLSSHLILPVICITTNNVTIAPIVTASPVKPSKKNAYENNTR